MNMKKKIIMLGAGQLQLPAIKLIKNLGFYLIVCDVNPNAIGFNFADEKHIISTQDKDAILELANKTHPQVVMTSTSDAPVRVAAYVNQKLGLSYGISYEDSICATIKSEMRKRLLQHGVPIPQFFVIKTFDDFCKAVKFFNFECIIKPSDNSASRGVVAINNNSSSLIDIYNYSLSNSKNRVLLVEEYMDGPEVSVESITINSTTYVIAITDKLVCEGNFFVELGHSQPSVLFPKTKDEIINVTCQAIAAIGIKNCASHTELKCTSNGVKVVEIAARLGGDCITSDLVPLSTGINILEKSVLLDLCEPIELPKNILEKSSVIRYIYGTKGIVKNILISKDINQIENLVKFELFCKVGDEVNNLESSLDRLGFVITSANNIKDAKESADIALSKIKIEIK